MARALSSVVGLLLANTITRGQALCAFSERCVVECGDSCMEKCDVDPDQIIQSQACRRKFVDDGGVLECSDHGCITPSECLTSEGSQCFFSCENECHESHEVNDLSQSECSHMCTSECGRLLDDENDSEAEEEGLSAQDVAECIKLCSIGSDCPGRDQIFEYDAAESVGHVVKSHESGASEVVVGEEWAYSGSPERESIAAALEDPESEEAQRYGLFIERLQEIDGFGDSLPGGMSPAELLASLGVEDGGLDDMSEEDMMQIIQQMMTGGMGGGYDDEYGSYGGMEDMYGGMIGEYEDDSGDVYEDDFEEEDDFSM